jgi:hypothetical protein
MLPNTCAIQYEHIYRYQIPRRFRAWLSLINNNKLQNICNEMLNRGAIAVFVWRESRHSVDIRTKYLKLYRYTELLGGKSYTLHNHTADNPSVLTE